MNENLFYRHFDLTRENIQDEDRSIEMSISSEAPFLRWFGTEIILHGKDNIDFSRLNSALLNHNPDKIIGRVTDARIERKKARARIIFDDDDLGNQAFAKVQSGSLKGVSIGYMIDQAKELKADEEWKGIKGPAIIATKTSIYEASLTPIPIDNSVGIGRDLTRSLEGIEIETSNQTQEVKQMEEKEIKQLIADAIGALDIPNAADITAAIRASIAEDAKPKLRVSPEEYIDLTSRAGVVSPECKLKVADMVGDGKNANEIKTYILDEATNPDARDGHGRQILDDKGGKKTDGPVTTFRQIEDDAFFAGLVNPAAFALN